MRRSTRRALLLAIMAVCAVALAPGAPAHALRPAWLGVYIDDVEFGGVADAGRATRVTITAVEPDTPASAAGLKWGDVIVEADRHPAIDVDNVVCIISAKPAGSLLTLTILRDGHLIAVSTVLAAWPEGRLRATRHCPPPLSS